MSKLAGWEYPNVFPSITVYYPKRKIAVPRLSRWERAFDKFMSRVIAAAGALTTGVIVGNSSIGPDDIGPATSSGTV